MATTYTLISSNTLSSSAASVTFSSIPATYTDLVLKFSIRGNRSSVYDQVYLDINGGGTAPSSRYVLGDGATASSGSSGNQISLANGSTATANTFGNGEVYIPNYLSSNYKPYGTNGVSENNATTAYASAFASLWQSTSAINSLVITVNSGTILSGSSFYLYGIKNS